MSSKFGGSIATKSSSNNPPSAALSGLTTLPASTAISVVTKPCHAFGVRGPLRDNVDYLSENRLIFPTGKRVCTYAIEKNEIEFIELHPDVQKVIGMSVAPNRKRVAFCELSLAEGGTTTLATGGNNNNNNPTEGKESKSSSSSTTTSSSSSSTSTSSKSPRGGLNPRGYKSQVSVYHALQGTHLRTLTLPNMKGVFTNCCFTADNKFLVAVGSAPDYKLAYWKWSNMKLIGSTSMPSEATRIRVNPNNSSQVTTTGVNHCKLWTLEKDLSLKCSSLLVQKTEKNEVFVDHAWTKIGTGSDGQDGGFILVTTEKGTVFVLQLNETGQSEIRQTIHLFAASQYKRHHQKAETIQSSAKGFVVGGTCVGTVVVHFWFGIVWFGFLTRDLFCCCFFSFLVWGVAVSLPGTCGYFAVYEQTDDQKDPFLPIRAFETGEHDQVTTVAISPLGETVCSFVQPSNQLMMFPLAHIDMIEQQPQAGAVAGGTGSNSSGTMIAANEGTNNSSSPFTTLRLNGFHAGAIVDLSVCFCRPIVATVGIDHTVRLWNYVTWECEISFSTGQEEPTCVTLHPSGFHILVGFKERVRMYNILNTELKGKKSCILFANNCLCCILCLFFKWSHLLFDVFLLLPSLFFFGMAQNTGPYLLKIAVNWPFHRVGICLHVRTASI